MSVNRLLLWSLSAVKRMFPAGSDAPVKKHVSILHLVLGMILYGVLPIDALPDFIPIIGQADDGVVILILSAIIIRILLHRRQKVPEKR